MTVLVDSDVMIDAAALHRQSLEALDVLAYGGLAISFVTYGELYEGVLGSRNPIQAEIRFGEMLKRLEIVSLDQAIVQRFASVRRGLRSKGLLIGDLDILIGCTALSHDFTLLTRNRKHFERIPGLRFLTLDDVLKG
jgi:tRNA(fMet)-specific endonuclease VapC